MREYTLLRPCGKEYADGSLFLQEGRFWGYRFNDALQWRKCLPGELGQHAGVDIICPVGTPLVSPLFGIIIAQGWHPKYGNRIIIRSQEAMINHLGVPCLPLLTMAHLSKFNHYEGKFLDIGEGIGLSGDTGIVSGPHLHCQLEEHGDVPRYPMKIKWR